MNRIKFRKGLISCFYNIILAGELAVLLDVLLVYHGTALSVPKFAALLAGLFLVLLVIPGFRLRQRRLAAAVCTAVLLIPLLVGGLCWYSVSQSVVYQSDDDGKAALYADQRVMLLVPHQDDDINVLGGILQEYVKYGSEVYVVFSTNGDYYGLAETRFREALDTLHYIGIPKDHVLFLGYGDQWSSEGPHIYNGKPEQVITSAFGRMETYGTAVSPVYREGRAYTIGHFLEDVEDVILEYRPDLIYCIDYDYNIDHRALSHAFEKVMGRILKEEKDYRPVVLKGYAYNTAWEAVADFHGENLLSTQNAFSESYGPVPGIYRWEDRVRLPVNGESLSRSVISAKQNIALSMYESQGANLYGVRVINSDKVFWHRRTDSLCYDADIRTSSGAAAMLNDFMLLECDDLRSRKPYDGAWIPGPEDGEKTAQITFAEETELTSIVLYDHPDPQVNVLNARITLADGISLETGPLDPGGAACAFAVDGTAVSSFSVTLLETEGDAGLTEIEAYSEEQQWQPDFVKIMDENENFVYDYWIDVSGEQLFELYDPSDMAGDFDVFCLNQHCSAVREGEKIRVECPEGQFCVVYVTGENGERLDTVYIRNPGSLERGWKMFWLRAEEKLLQLCETKRLHERVFVCRLAAKAMDLLR